MRNKKNDGFSCSGIERIEYEYYVKMDHVANNGSIVMSHYLDSNYEMIPTNYSKHPSMFDADYNIICMNYVSGKGKNIEWTFAKEKKISTVLFDLSVEGAYEYIDKQGNKLVDAQWSDIEELMKQLPKLPATGIFHAFVYDLIGMDQILSHVLSCGDNFFDSKEYRNVKSLTNQDFTISAGLYDADSGYHNGNMLVSLVGNNIILDKEVDVYHFKCDDASFNATQGNKSKCGVSYYFGTLVVEHDSQLLYSAEMCEYIFSESNKIMRRQMTIKQK